VRTAARIAARIAADMIRCRGLNATSTQPLDRVGGRLEGLLRTALGS